ncbi:hypothetical protein RCL1_005560 [Eukaryota sp. TZLM3-RCL]
MNSIPCDCCPDIFRGASDLEYKKYRIYVISKLPGLKFLDSSPITEVERQEAIRIGQYLKVSSGPSKKVDVSFVPPSPEVDLSVSSNVGVVRFQYTGKNSEGNKFIMNDHL